MSKGFTILSRSSTEYYYIDAVRNAVSNPTVGPSTNETEAVAEPEVDWNTYVDLSKAS